MYIYHNCQTQASSQLSDYTHKDKEETKTEGGKRNEKRECDLHTQEILHKGRK